MGAEKRLTLLYVVFGCLWIIISDEVMFLLLGVPLQPIAIIETLSGIAFVLVTAALLHWILRREFQNTRALARRADAEEARYQRIFQDNPNPMWITDPKTLRFQEVNAAAVKKYGYSASEFTQMSLPDLLPSQAVEAKLDTLTEPNNPLRPSGDQRHITRDGRIIEVEIASHLTEYEGQQALLSVAHDVTERKRIRRELKRAHNQIENVINAIEMILWTAEDGDFSQAYVNDQAVRRIYGRAARAFTEDASLWIRCGHPDDRERMQRAEAELQRGTTRDIEYRIVRPDGDVRWVHDRAWAVFDDNGDILRLEGIVIDVTERKLLHEKTLENERLSLALKKESEVNVLRNRFMSMISHEFRTPLTALLSSAGLLEDYGDQMDAPRRQRHLRRIHEQVSHLTLLLDDILTLLKTENPTQEVFNPVPQDIVPLVRDVAQEIALNTDQQIDLDIPESLAVDGDGRLLRQMIDNLVSNAVKYSPDDTPVALRLSAEDSGVCLQVVDSGIGIPEKDLPNVFRPFHRGANVGEARGTGLGLAVTRRVVELHGGDIRVESIVGQGTTFTVTLPPFLRDFDVTASHQSASKRVH